MVWTALWGLLIAFLLTIGLVSWWLMTTRERDAVIGTLLPPPTQYPEIPLREGAAALPPQRRCQVVGWNGDAIGRAQLATELQGKWDMLVLLESPQALVDYPRLQSWVDRLPPARGALKQQAWRAHGVATAVSRDQAEAWWLHDVRPKSITLPHTMFGDWQVVAELTRRNWLYLVARGRREQLERWLQKENRA